MLHTPPMPYEPTLGDLDQLVRRLESDLDQRLGRLEHKVDAVLATLPAGAPAADQAPPTHTVPATPMAPAAPAAHATPAAPMPPPASATPAAPMAPPAHATPAAPMPPAAPPAPTGVPAPVQAGWPWGPPPAMAGAGAGMHVGAPGGGAAAADGRRLPPPPAGPAMPPPSGPPGASPAPKPSFDFDFDLDLTPERFVRWAGLVLVALAAIFLVSTAIQRGWIGPELQLVGATAAGLGLLAGAFRLRDHGPGWSTSLGIAGATVLAFCATATHTWLDLVPAPAAVVALAAASAASVAAAWRLGRESVAVAAGLAALLVPPALGLHTDLTPGVTALALAALVATATALGLVRPWPLVRTGVSWLAALMLLAVVAEVDLVRERVEVPGRGPASAVAVALATAALWLGPVLATLLVGHRPPPDAGDGTPRSPFVHSLLGPSTVGEQLAALDHRLLAIVPAWCWLAVAAVTGTDQPRPFGLLGLAVGAGFALVAAASWLRLPPALGLIQALGVSGVVAVALIALVDGPLLMVALTVQTAATAVVAHRFRDTALGVSAGITGALAVLLATGDIFRTIGEGDPTVGGALAQAFVVAAVGATAFVVHRFGRRDLAGPAFVAAWGLTLLWTVATFLPGPQGNVVVSAVWAAMAVGAIVAGLRWISSISATVRTVGLLTLALTVGKLLTVDLAVVDVFWRAGLFFLVGAGLLRLAYVLPRLAAQARERAAAAAVPPQQPQG